MMNNEITNIDIDLNEFDKDVLIRLIIYAHVNDLTFNESIVELLEAYLPQLEEKKDENQLPLL